LFLKKVSDLNWTYFAFQFLVHRRFVFNWLGLADVIGAGRLVTLQTLGNVVDLFVSLQLNVKKNIYLIVRNCRLLTFGEVRFFLYMQDFFCSFDHLNTETNFLLLSRHWRSRFNQFLSDNYPHKCVEAKSSWNTVYCWY
jgi:hypothetical protein